MGVRDRLLGRPAPQPAGTTWVLNQLGRADNVAKIDEPGIGVHLGVFLHEFFGAPAATFPPERSLMNQLRSEEKHYFFAERYADAWRPHLRALVLARFAAQLEDVGKAGALCAVKEPNGSQAAELLLDVLPGSRLLWILRDGRDVVDSELDGILPGGWMERYGANWDMTEAERLRYVEDRAVRWLRRTGYVQAAYDRLPDDQRLLVRYEDLRANTAGELQRIFDWLGHPLEPGEAQRIADAHAFERIPADDTGRGKFARSATPGGWRDSLSAQEQERVEAAIGPKLRELGYE
jgi:sulfotransferase family protein